MYSEKAEKEENERRKEEVYKFTSGKIKHFYMRIYTLYNDANY